METVIKAIILYLAAFFVSSVVLPKKADIQTSVDMLLMIIFGGIVTLATLSGDYSLTNAILAIATIALVHVVVMYLKAKMVRD